MWCEVFEGGVHDGTQVDTAEVAWEGAEGVLRVRIVDVEAGLAAHRDVTVHSTALAVRDENQQHKILNVGGSTHLRLGSTPGGCRMDLHD